MHHPLSPHQYLQRHAVKPRGGRPTRRPKQMTFLFGNRGLRQPYGNHISSRHIQCFSNHLVREAMEDVAYGPQQTPNSMMACRIGGLSRETHTQYRNAQCSSGGPESWDCQFAPSWRLTGNATNPASTSRLRQFRHHPCLRGLGRRQFGQRLAIGQFRLPAIMAPAAFLVWGWRMLRLTSSSMAV
jgi:hypothetical protein